MKFYIESMHSKHWLSVKRIYQEGIDTGVATFEVNTPEWQIWDKNHLPDCRLVVQVGNRIIAWAALSPVSDRCVYGGVAEVSIYVAQNSRSKGVASSLLKALIEESEKSGIWTLQAGIFPENIASIKLHLKCGFVQVGIRKKLGKLNGIWRDVVLLERRSDRVGIE